MVATRFLKRRQRVPKPRDRAPKFTLKSSPWEARGQHRRNRQGGEGSSVRPGSQERGKGTGWIAWKPGRSRSRPRASKPIPGPDRGKRGAVRREPLTGNTGENFESHKPVHETTTGS